MVVMDMERIKKQCEGLVKDSDWSEFWKFIGYAPKFILELLEENEWLRERVKELTPNEAVS